MKTTRPKTIIVGAGIVGAAIAYHLARRGAAVTHVDKGQPAGEVTGKAFAWINVSHGLPEPYLQLRHQAIQDYRRLERELNHALPLDWSGALTWTSDPAETERFAREHAAWGYDVRLVGREEIAALEPKLKELPYSAAFAASEGAVDPIAMTEILVRAAKEAGADVRLNTQVLALTSRGNEVTGLRIVEGTIDADVVVLAAGVSTGALCRPLGVTIPLDSSPSILLRFRTQGRLVNRVVSNPYMEVRQVSETVMLGAEDYIDDSAENGPEAVARRALAQVRERLAGGETVELDSVSVGLRPIPGDGFPIIGYAPQVDGLYIAVMHAGVTLAPAAGRFAATEILDGGEVKLLAPCRAQRFMNAA